jgi:hypothetical protein
LLIPDLRKREVRLDDVHTMLEMTITIDTTAEDAIQLVVSEFHLLLRHLDDVSFNMGAGVETVLALIAFLRSLCSCAVANGSDR